MRARHASWARAQAASPMACGGAGNARRVPATRDPPQAMTSERWWARAKAPSVAESTLSAPPGAARDSGFPGRGGGRGRVGLSGHEPTGGTHRESGGVMIGMAALRGMADDAAAFELAEERREPQGERREAERRLLVRATDADKSFGGQAREGQRGLGLASTRRGV